MGQNMPEPFNPAQICCGNHPDSILLEYSPSPLTSVPLDTSTEYC